MLRCPVEGKAPAGKLKVMVQISPIDADNEQHRQDDDADDVGLRLARNQSTPVTVGRARTPAAGTTVVAAAAAALGPSIVSCSVTVRLYVIRAFRLVAKDAGNSSDPFVIATIDGKPGAYTIACAHHASYMHHTSYARASVHASAASRHLVGGLYRKYRTDVCTSYACAAASSTP